MLVHCTETTQTIQIEQIIILTRDIRQLACKTITVHLDTANNTIPADEIYKMVKEEMHWMGHIFFSRSLFTERSAFSGSVRLALNRRLQNKNIQCTRVNIADVQILI